jgi:ABC-2 type transport system permease protein
MRFFTVFKTCIKISCARAAVYRFNFLLSLGITFVGSLAFPLVALLIYGAGAAFPGWGFHEVLLIQSLFTLSRAMVQCVMDNMLWETMNHVREGKFETVLLKPMDPLTYMVTTTFSPNSFGNFLCGAVLFGYAVTHAGVASFASALAGFVLFVAGVMVMAGLQLIMAALSFKWVGNSRLYEIFSGVESFGQYPISIFPAAIRAVITFAIPVGLVGFYPAAALLGRAGTEGFAAAGFSLVFFGLGIGLYKYMVRLYKGAGG